ncbi:hypothetical protein L195_g019628 [Trifolium pratense]|uniref:Uncharacterized protein n=1 Tax=Trifolium pratense TaxID=57577 RepID=A0A2K3N078_TRIPR|nr:hypothetical protein L195_g019628 [Trifolium pratense]
MSCLQVPSATILTVKVIHHCRISLTINIPEVSGAVSPPPKTSRCGVLSAGIWARRWSSAVVFVFMINTDEDSSVLEREKRKRRPLQLHHKSFITITDIHQTA